MSTSTIQQQRSGKKTAARALLSATVIGTLFLCWATFVNWQHGAHAAIHAGIGQGGVSFVMSMSMAFMLEFLFFLPSNKLVRIPFAVVITMLVVTAFTTLVHLIIGTPEIIKTMALPIMMGIGYTTLYCLRLSRMEVGATTAD
ncbi:hypothetical protein [Teredinibacter turnerae]|uniref:hypothetical protein n=1 Tax=Teredinibacter turnerae TaxID=2426 RepID=UPI000369A9C0|nr:hypothetical protein [Teredinibacter turnerae]